jgi:hypothetical protein
MFIKQMGKLKYKQDCSNHFAEKKAISLDVQLLQYKSIDSPSSLWNFAQQIFRLDKPCRPVYRLCRLNEIASLGMNPLYKERLALRSLSTIRQSAC